MTQQQQKLLKFLEAKERAGEPCPSYDEMMQFLELRSKSGVFRLIEVLHERGHIRRMPNRARSIEVVRASSEEFERGFSKGWAACEAQMRSGQAA